MKNKSICAQLNANYFPPQCIQIVIEKGVDVKMCCFKTKWLCK